MRKTLRLIENDTFFLVKDRKEKYIRFNEVKNILRSLGYCNTKDRWYPEGKHSEYIIWKNKEGKRLWVGSWFLENEISNISFAYQGNKYNKEKLIKYINDNNIS